MLRTYDAAVDWFILRGSSYERLEPSGGVYRSEAFPGLWLDSAALLQGDLAQILKVLQQGLSTPEHAAFVSKLREAASKTPPRA